MGNPKVFQRIMVKVEYPHNKQGYLWLKIDRGVVSIKEPGMRGFWEATTLGRLHVLAAEGASKR
jgi:hypothetical protein